MDEGEIVAALLKLDLLKPVPEENREPIAKLLAEVSDRFVAEPGECVLKEGHLGFACGFIMLDGDAEIVRKGTVVAGLKPPALLGEMSQFGAKDLRTASVRSSSPSNFLQFDWKELYERAEEELGARTTHLLRAAVERLIFKRFGHTDLLNLPLFSGLGDDLAYKVCVVFPWLTERVKVPKGETLFHANTRCQAKGHLLVEGQVLLRWPEGREVTVAAPNILGVLPQNDPKLNWSATAIALQDVTALVFNWQKYMATLQERLSPDSMAKVAQTLQANAGQHFQH